MTRFAYMRVRYDILGVSLFMALYDYDPAMLWDVEGDVFKREAPAAKKYVEKILAIRE